MVVEDLISRKITRNDIISASVKDTDLEVLMGGQQHYVHWACGSTHEMAYWRSRKLY